MDGFDDLLPSRSALEENPFEDPFAKPRSGSPDPWNSWSNHPQSTSSEPPGEYQSSADDGGSITPTDSLVTTGKGGVATSEHSDITSSPTDPLDSAAQTADDDDEPLRRSRPSDSTFPQTPGFRESVPPPFDEIATIRPTVPEELEPSTPSKSYFASQTSEVLPSVPSTPSHHTTSSISSKNAIISPSSSAATVERNVASPLESPASGHDHSFPSLALGGESVGGWQGTQSSWANDQQTAHTHAPIDDDDDDDKPIRQSSKSEGHSSLAPAESPLRKDKGITPVFVISVEDPQKVGDPIRSFTMYTVTTRTTSPLFTKATFSVLRRYSDFLWLYETLSMNNPGVVVPPAPEKNPFGRFDDQFVQQRRLALERCIQKIANHPVLFKDPDLKIFLESDNFALDIKHRKAERGGLMASIGQSIAGPRFYEMDEWFDRQKAYLDSLESQLRGLVKAIEVVAKHRAELATTTAEFAQTVDDLSSSDIGKQLSHSLSALADMERKAQELQSTQSQQDMVTLMSTVDEYARLISSVRLAFHSRVRTYHAWQNADSQVKRVKQSHENARVHGGQQLGHSLGLLAEAERRALEAKHEFDHCSKLIKSEVARFERERIEDFKNSLHAFLDGMIKRQKQLLSGWEGYQLLLLKKVGGGQQVIDPP